MNQQLLVEEFLKMKMRQETERMRDNPKENSEDLNWFLISEDLNRFLIKIGTEQDQNYAWFKDDKGRIKLSTLLDWRCGFNGDFEGDTGKEFFKWSKEKCRELDIPVSTFKTIKETREIATRLTEEWYEKFETIEEVVAWFEGDEFCLK